MKKIKFTILLCYLLLVISIVVADNEYGNLVKGGNLLITDLDVKVDSKTHKDIEFGDEIKYESKPGSIVEFNIEVKNNFTQEQKLDIEDIEVITTIKKIDDGDDLEQEAKEFDLKPRKDKKVKLQFQVPLDVKEGDYAVLIEAKGKDDNRTTHKVEYETILEVKKERYEIVFFEYRLTPSEVSCNSYIRLDLGIINTGSKDLDNVALQIINTELEIEVNDTFNLDNRPFKEDNKFKKEFTFTLPDDVKAGTYTIMSKVSYNNGKNEKQESIELMVNDCKKVETPTKETLKNETKKKEQIELVLLPEQKATPKDPSQSLVPIISLERGVFQPNEFLIILLMGETLLALILVMFIMYFVSKRRAYNPH